MARPARPDKAESAAESRLQEINAVFGLLLVLTQASTPARAMHLVTTAVPSIAPGHTAVGWPPSRSGDYYQQAPDQAAGALAQLPGPGRIEASGAPVGWAFPLTAALGREPVFLIAVGQPDLSEQETFLLAVLAQMCGTVVASHELSAEAALRAQATREARQRPVLEAALDAVVTIDHEARVTYVNSAFEQTFGCSSADVVGRDLAAGIVPPPLRAADPGG